MAQACFPARTAGFDTPLIVLAHRWRIQRVELRRHLLHLCSCELLPADPDDITALHQLCGDLIDYVSTGHFEVYARLLRSLPALDDDLRQLLRHILHSIGRTTDTVLAFNDRYFWWPNPHGDAHLPEELGKLSRCLLLRFALEEQLLELAGGAVPLVHTPARAQQRA